MATKTDHGLVDYAVAQLGRPYWYGTCGYIATEELYLAKKKQYPKNYTATDYASQYGQKVCDCVGLIKGYLWSENADAPAKYNKDQDVSANGMRNHCKEQGTIDTMPDIPGVLVFMDGHVGVYIGNGEVVEARGHKYGVVQTKFASRAWKWWGKCDWIEYTDTAKKVDISVTVVKRGMKGYDCIRTLQRLLNALNFKGADNKPLAVDSSFGLNTDYAVRAYQKSRGLDVDGSVGKKTWTSLIG